MSRRTALALLSLGVLLVAAPARGAIHQIYEKPDSSPPWAEVIETLWGREDFGESYALVVGVSSYKGGFDPLEAPRYDALRVRDFLINAGFDLVVTLTDEEATQDRIEQYMEEFFPDRVRGKDRFLFYFSGHGTQRRLASGRIRGYLPLAASGQGRWSRMISMDDVADWQRTLENGRHVVFVLDACFSGLAGIQQKSTDLRQLTFDDLARSGHHLLTAGTEDQVSVASLGRWKGSLFTAAFIEGAQGAADAATGRYPRDGLVSLSELRNYIRQRVNEEKMRDPRLRIDQTAQWTDLKGASRGEFFFVTDEARERVESAAMGERLGLETLSGSPPESKGPEGAAPTSAIAQLLRQQADLEAQRTRLLRLERQLGLNRYGFDEADTAETARDPAEIRRALVLRQEVSQRSDRLSEAVVEHINSRWLVEKEERTDDELIALRIKTEEDLWIAREWVERGGDYFKAVQILEAALELDPENIQLRETRWRWAELRYVDREPFTRIKKGMSRTEVADLIGRPLVANVQEYPKKKARAWFYRKDPAVSGEMAAAGVYFRLEDEGWRVYASDFYAVGPKEGEGQ